MDSTSERRSLRPEEPRRGGDATIGAAGQWTARSDPGLPTAIDDGGRRAPSAGGWAGAQRHLPGGPHWQSARSLERPAARRGPPGDDSESAQRLLLLTEELGKLAGEIAEASKPHPAPPAEVDAGFVRRLIRARKRRVAAFGADLFADPVWDMMLDLLAARLEGRRVSTSSLCIAAGVPGTTALRWIRLLTERGLFVRAADPRDGRAVLIGLSDDAAEQMMAHLATSCRSLAA